MTAGRPLRVALIPQPSKAWMGGVNYFRNLCDVLLRFVPERVQPVLFLGTQVDAELGAIFDRPGLEMHRDPRFDAAAIRRRTILALGGVRDKVLAQGLAEARIDVLFETMAFAGTTPPVPSLAWFPDFQHRRLPHMFPWHVRARRDLLVRSLLSGRRTLMLSSRDSERDAIAFFEAEGRTAVVPFALPAQSVPAQPWAPDPTLELPERFLFLPNQIWRHKNHQVVIEALGLLALSERPVVICTGATHDPREPELLNRLKLRVDQLGVGHWFRFLGLRPYADVQGLLRSAMAVLNPSRFEGWSTTIEECKALGAPMLLSDIPVHREQADGMALFFGPDDPGALAGLLRSVAAGAILPRPDASQADFRAAAFAEAFAAAACKAHAGG